MKRLIFMLTALILVSACNQEADSVSVAPAPAFQLSMKGEPFESREEQVAYGKQLNRLAMDILPLMRAEQLDEAQRLATSIVANVPEGRLRDDAEQMTAQALLSTWMVREEATPQFIAAQVEPLIAHRSPTPDLIADALERLEGFWSEEQIARAAGKAADAAVNALREEGECEACSRQQIEEKIMGSEGRRARLLQMQASLQRLDRMAS